MSEEENKNKSKKREAKLGGMTEKQLEQMKDNIKETVVNIFKSQIEKNNDAEIIEITSFLGDKINVGEIWLGYDLERINLTAENSEFYDSYKDKLSRVILCRKKPELEKGKKLKLKQLDMEREIIKPKGKKNEEENNKEMEDFLEEIYEDNDLRENVEIENENEKKNEENKDK